MFKKIVNFQRDVSSKAEVLGRAIAEALKNWIYKRKQEKIAKEALDMMDHGFACGKLMYRQRSELHER